MKHKLPQSFINELNEIGKEKPKAQNFEKLDLSELGKVPPKKKDLKKIYSTGKYRKRKR